MEKQVPLSKEGCGEEEAREGKRIALVGVPYRGKTGAGDF